MFAVEASIFVRNEGVGHGASSTCGQDGVSVTKRLGSDCEGSQLNFFLPLGHDNQLGEFVVARAGGFVAFELGGDFSQGVVDVRGIDVGQFVVGDFGDEEPASAEYGIEGSIRTGKERRLHKLGDKVVHIIHL